MKYNAKNIDACATLLGISSEDLKSRLNSTNDERLISYNRACEILGISKPTLKRMIKAGTVNPIVVVKHPKIKMSEVESILEG